VLLRIALILAASLVLGVLGVLGVPGVAPAAGQPARDAGDVVALVPLAAEARFALYGQPVASEVARSLRAGSIDVVVVSAGAPVPARARLVIDGRISGEAGGAVSLEVRVRDPAKGVVVATLHARASALTAIDRAASDLAERLLPAVREQLAVLDRAADRAAAAAASRPPTPPATRPAPTTTRPARPPAVIEIGGAAFPAAMAMAKALAERLELEPMRGSTSAPPSTGIALRIDVLGFDVQAMGVLVGRARVRIRATDARGVVFDRVVRTDSIVGRIGASRDELARSAAAQVIDIAAPRLRDGLRGRR
jgi:hypothetical protein